MIGIFIEVSDLIFAVDSIPAILAITSDPFIVFTSNVFAILGLRSLFFAISAISKYFIYLKYGLAAILTYVGTKMLVSDYYKIDPLTLIGDLSHFILVNIYFHACCK